MVIDMVCMIQRVLTSSSSQEPNFTSQPAGDGSVLSPAGFRSALIHTQPVPPQTGHSNSSDITLLYGVLDQLGPFNSHSYF